MDIEQLSAAVEEVSKGYAARFDIERSADWFVLKLHEELGELTQCHLMATGRARPKGRSAEEIRDDLHAEMADVLSHVLLLARFHGVDLEAAVTRKWLSRDSRTAAPSPAPGSPG
ncbi:MazG nucleotide pyrophosphohydrolase domain-containing protein [Actinorugispora endophytica]|uniref:NTP pyrophosphatase (Non-canonical NTP hydrolase) n=1 Tax=Actinorugispora endophytica TaxID=1605990 RepID=A0A4R6VDS9_9ACTN|nr:MazG nucleotide pyrophosphohydrolase domain-containing protein [Actinorugispora endophytica]TDQ55167.1 NTP pyrophosphatase (non-canonical NTP hydrolase) [Actinorugispora endophytica]